MKKNKWFRTFASVMSACTIAISALSGCSDKSRDNENIENIVENTIPGEDAALDDDNPYRHSESITSDGITVTIATDKESYEAGETVNFIITVDNRLIYRQINAFTFEYNKITGLTTLDGSDLPNKFGIIKAGESASLTCSLTGCEGAVLGGESGTKTTQTSAEYDTLTLRPYLIFNYDGKEVMIRGIMELHILQQKVALSGSELDNPKKTSCHDPSIFKDFDGTYYIFGTHLGLSKSTDLRNWTNMDNTFRASFTSDVKEKIRSYNKDESAGDWWGYLWAPDVIYNTSMGKYCMYLSANGDDWVSNIVMLTADKAEGPYSYAGSVVYGGFTTENYDKTDVAKATGEKEIAERYITNGVKNRKWGDKYPNCIDPCVFYDDDGKLYMSYGSWSGGIFLLELDENTGLRDYDKTYADNNHSDPYFGSKIAGGCYVSGEGSYIQKIGEYYYLFISYGALEAKGGYNIRVFRSKYPDRDYADELGNTPFYDIYYRNHNDSVGIRLFGGYKWRTFNYGQVAQGHNSAFVDDDNRAFIIFHTRTTNGSEAHNVKVHQLFMNREGWLCAAPYQTSGESFDADRRYSSEEVAGQYEVILHELDIDYKNLEAKKAKFVNLNADGSITGEYEGSWELMNDSAYIYITIDGVCYSGVMLDMKVENSSITTTVFTALGDTNQLTIWGIKSFK